MKKYQDGSLLVLRLVIAAIFFYATWGKWTYLMSGALVGGMAALTWFLLVVEPILGIGVLLGYKTKISAIGIAVIMAGAVLFLKFGYGTALFTGPTGAGLDYNLLILAGSLVIASFGAGKYSIEK